MSKSVCVKDNPVAFNKHWVHVTSSSYLSLTVVPTSKCMLIITDTIATIIFNPHGIAMLKGLYFTAVVFLLFLTRNLLRSLNGSQPNLETYSLMTVI